MIAFTLLLVYGRVSGRPELYLFVGFYRLADCDAET